MRSCSLTRASPVSPCSTCRAVDTDGATPATIGTGAVAVKPTPRRPLSKWGGRSRGRDERRDTPLSVSSCRDVGGFPGRLLPGGSVGCEPGPPERSSLRVCSPMVGINAERDPTRLAPRRLALRPFEGDLPMPSRSVAKPSSRFVAKPRSVANPSASSRLVANPSASSRLVANPSS